MSTSIEVAPNFRSSPTDVTVAPQRAAQQHESGAGGSAHASDAAHFVSPVIRVDSDTGLALLVVRDGDTGKALDQYPSQKVVEEYQRHQTPGTSEVPAVTSAPDTTVDPASNPAVQVAVATAAPAPAVVSAPSTVSSGTPAVTSVTKD